jgi:hypothetical protein
VRRDLLTESRKHGATKLLRQIPSIGPIRAALAEIVSSPQKPSSAVVHRDFHSRMARRRLWKSIPQNLTAD